jgi:hypothetical protein
VEEVELPAQEETFLVDMKCSRYTDSIGHWTAPNHNTCSSLPIYSIYYSHHQSYKVLRRLLCQQCKKFTDNINFVILKIFELARNKFCNLSR